MKANSLKSLLAALTFSVAIENAGAESYIAQVPSATIVSKNTHYLEGDAVISPLPLDKGGFYSGMLRWNYGLTDDVEIGLNVLGTFAASAYPAELQPTIKYRWYRNDKSGLQISSGVTGYLPVYNSNLENGFAMLYTVGRYQTDFAGAYSPAVSLGGWALVNRDSNTGSQAGVIVGLEQPLILDERGKPFVSLTADWESGNQTHPGFSAFTPAVVVQMRDDVVVGAGYSISNFNHSYDAAVLFVGFSF